LLLSRLSSQGVAQLTVIMGAVDLRDPAMVVKRVHSITRHRGFDATKLVTFFFNFDRFQITGLIAIFEIDYVVSSSITISRW
jgi:acetolactate synthase regulatory subunit